MPQRDEGRLDSIADRARRVKDRSERGCVHTCMLELRFVPVCVTTFSKSTMHAVIVFDGICGDIGQWPVSRVQSGCRVALLLQSEVLASGASDGQKTCNSKIANVRFSLGACESA